MIHRIKICLLLIALLVCPVHCTSASSSDEAPAQSPAARCTCCHPEPDSAPDSLPEDDCCSSCLCAGATLDDTIELADICSRAPRSPHVWNIVRPDVKLMARGGAIQSTGNQYHRLSARDALVAAQVWLI